MLIRSNSRRPETEGCNRRALANNPKILLSDEATSAPTRRPPNHFGSFEQDTG